MTALFFALDTERPSVAASHRDLHADCGIPHLPSAVANELTEVGWPAVATPVGPDVGPVPEWRERYNNARRERRREQCRAAHRRWLDKQEGEQ